MDQHFYQNLGSFSDLEELSTERHFSKVPEDWCVVLVQVMSSTEAVESGQYKDVNTMGAAAIVITQDVLKSIEIPFVPGGDGSVILIPGKNRKAVGARLGTLIDLAEKGFKLDLRIGLFEVSELTGDGLSLEVAKFEMTPGRSLALLRGGGWSRAEELLRGNSGDRYRIPRGTSSPADLKRLSCWWHDLPNRRGNFLSLILVTREEENFDVYLGLIGMLDRLLSESLSDSDSRNLDQPARAPLSDLIREGRKRHQKGSLRWVVRCLGIFSAVLDTRHQVSPMILNPQCYTRTARPASKSNDVSEQLQMIIDCTAEQKKEIIAYLGAAHAKGELFYGLHESRCSPMTCYVHDLRDGNHIQFVDGGDGGYTMAAKRLTEQIASNGK